MQGILNEKRYDPFTAVLSMRELYDTEYSIYDHGHPEAGPMAVFEMHAAEDPHTGGELERLEQEILQKRLPEILNTPITEILNFPRYRLDFYLKWATKPTETELNLKRLEEEANKRAESVAKS